MSSPINSFDAVSYLKSIGDIPDHQIDLCYAAIALAAPHYKGRSLERYFHHLRNISDQVRCRHAELLSSGGDDNAESRLAALKHILADKYGYAGDTQDYDNLMNADLIAVIDRAKGLPITLSLLYICAARAQGWVIDGLNIPGHFLARLSHKGRMIIFDPFERANPLEAPQIRGLVKKALGANAELASSYFEPMNNRDILIRLQNNIKSRQIEMAAYDDALETVRQMRLIYPQEFRLLLDEGVLLSKTDQPVAAMDSLENYIAKVTNPKDKRDAEILLDHIKSLIHS